MPRRWATRSGVAAPVLPRLATRGARRPEGAPELLCARCCRAGRWPRGSGAPMWPMPEPQGRTTRDGELLARWRRQLVGADGELITCIVAVTCVRCSIASPRHQRSLLVLLQNIQSSCMILVSLLCMCNIQSSLLVCLLDALECFCLLLIYIIVLLQLLLH